MHGVKKFLRGEVCESIPEDRERDHKARDGAGDANVEQSFAARQRRTYADDRSHRTERIREERGDRNEVWQRHVDLMITSREVMAELMRGEDGQKAEGVRQPVREIRKVKDILIEPLDSGECSRKECENK